MYSVLGSLAKDMVILLWLSLRDLFADFLSFFFRASEWPCRLATVQPILLQAASCYRLTVQELTLSLPPTFRSATIS